MSQVKCPASHDGPVGQFEPSKQLEFLRCLLECSGHLILGFDMDGRFFTANSGAEILLGHRHDELIGRSVYDYVDASDHEKLQEYIEQLSKERNVFGNLSLKNKQNVQVPCDLCFLMWRDDKGQALGVVVTGQDVSSWNQLQEDLVRVDRLAEIGRMAAGIVHELKNPLSVINQAAGWAGVLVQDAKNMKDRDRDELIHTLKEVEEQTNRCKSITSKVLDYVRGTEPEKKDFDIKELLQQTIRYMEPELKFPPIEIVTFFSEESIMVDSVFQLLQQVFVNLLSNAIYAIREANKRDGRIEVSIESNNLWTTIFVTDNGMGIPKHKQDRIFDLFYTTKPSGKGTGLGLPISRNILYKLGGNLSFESKEDEGTTFIVTLPK